MPLLGVILHIFALIHFSLTYRLNVPRVLLPYHPSIPVKYVLEVSQPSGGCFKWSSTRPDVVAVTPIGSKSDVTPIGSKSECSDRAEIRATAKAASGELSAVVFAEDRGSGTMLSCGVTVDQISKIRIKTTTKILFVDAAPARILVEALNAEGDTFSTLSEIPVAWGLSHTGEGRPLRIVPFEQSTYDAPAEIVALENTKKKGYIILVEGVQTGSATLTAKFVDAHLKNIPSHKLDLTVVANLLLLPARDLFLPLNAVVPFQVHIVKQSSTEMVAMPSSSYYLKVDSENICSLDKMTSSIRALARGRTDIHLFSHNVDVKAKAGVRPPSTSISVVDPETIQWVVSENNNWLLETGTRYQLCILLLDSQGNSMFISDNLRFDSIIPSDYFEVHSTSKNQTHFEVTPKKVGKVVLRSRFTAVLDEIGKEQQTTEKVFGEQPVQIVDPIQITPSEAVFPYIARRKISFPLKVTGGSGLYDWSAEDTTVCVVDSNGALSCSSLGTTTITASDKRNPAHKDVVHVSVVDVLSLTFGDSHKEAEVGSDLLLNMQLVGAGPSGPIPFTDCRAADFLVHSSDDTVFKHVQGATPTLPTKGTGCSTVVLKAISSGDAKITVSFLRHEATIVLSVYPVLKMVKDNLALAVGSSLSVRFEGGPRPWVLDSSSHFREASADKLVTTNILDGVIDVKCGSDSGIATLRLQVGNHPSASLSLPAMSAIDLTVCCTAPRRLLISRINGNQPKCPTNEHLLLSSASMKLAVAAYGSCGNDSERHLDSANGFTVEWTTSNKSVATVSGIDEDETSAYVSGLGVAGSAVITVELSAKSRFRNRLRANLELRVVKPAFAEPHKLVLWNEVEAVGVVRLDHGSGHFTVHELPGAPFTAAMKDNTIMVTPKSQGGGSLRIEDVCINGDPLDIPVKITDIHALVIYGLHSMEVGSVAEVSVDAVDEAGNSFSRAHGAYTSAVIESSDRSVLISKISGSLYHIRAFSVGGFSLVASAKSASGTILYSRPHAIQVFSPFLLRPEEITLIQESSFQLEVVGGPQPTLPIHFALNNSKIASVEPNALITSSKLGYTSITGTVDIGDGHSSQSTVVLRVVSLAGIRAVASTHITERGAQVWVRVSGLDENESPFSFGGALHPFKVTWTVSHPGVLQVIHPFGSSISETDDNRFAVWLEGCNPGSATVKVRVELSTHAKRQFAGSTRVFEDTTEIRVEEPLVMFRPNLMVPTIRVTQNTEIQLETAWPQSVLEYSVPSEFADRLSVTKSGLVQTKSIAGPAAIVVRRTDLPDNETSLVPVTISAVHSLDVLILTKLELSTSTPLMHLPVGIRIVLKLVFRDSKGRELSAPSNNKISYRPHRFDLTEIVASNANSTLTITLKSAGETVLKIWDSADPSLNVFIRLSAVEMLYQSTRKPTVSDIICFTSPLAGTSRWLSNGNHIEWLDVERGFARLTHPGTAHVTVKVAEQKLTTALSISPAQQLTFATSVPDFVSNAEGASFVFPVNIVANETASHAAIIGCTEEQLTEMPSIQSPFECTASFVNSNIGPAMNILSIRAIFSSKFGSYACVVERQEVGQVHLDIVSASQMDLTLTAKWSGDSQIRDAAVTTIFHAAMRVLESEIQLSDIDQRSATLSVQVPAYQLRYVTASGCPGDIVTITEIRQPSGANVAANKFFVVKLNVKLATLWNDLSQKCLVKVENGITEQKIYVPVRIRIVGQAAKQVYNALDSTGFIEFVLIFLQHYSWIIPSLMWICLLGIFTIVAYWFIRRRIWERQGTFNDSSAMRSPLSGSATSVMSAQSSPSELS